MFCSNCGTKIEEGDKFCKKCGREQGFTVLENEKVGESDLSESENKYDDVDIENENENGIIPSKDPEAVIIKKESFLKKIFKGVGTGGLVVGVRVYQ